MSITISPSHTAPSAWVLRAEQFLEHPLDEVFEIFANAFNLEEITPPWLNFSVMTPGPIRMREGRRIDYRLRVHRWPIRWQSWIAAWEPPHRFVDEQVRGPYRFWRHEHRFEARDGGTFVTDEVSYGVPGGRLVHKLLVKRDLLRIFQFRQQRLEELISVHAGTPSVS